MAKIVKTENVQKTPSTEETAIKENMFKVGKLRELNSACNKIMSECTIGKNITETAVDFFLDLSEALESLLKRVDKKIELVNESIKKTTDEFSIKHANGAQVRTADGVKVPEPGANPAFDKINGELNTTVNSILNEEIEFTTSLKLNLADFPTEVNALYRKVFRPYTVKE